ncbi:MAG: hypothetical protein EOP51_12590 [Sphingobacteriales bacterium]|nr:MAG: hypothetical protein EOP51_12590 [Sphingobacteriales bacterium]
MVVYGQKSAPVTTLAGTIDSGLLRLPTEKVYLHLDRPYYNNTDTIWLKAYVLDGGLENSKQSGLLYTELVNDTGKVVLRQSMPVMLGLSWGQMILDEKLVAEGNYTLRAYTNWMQNTGQESFFTRQLYISKADEQTWLVKTSPKPSPKERALKEDAEVLVQIIDQAGSPVRLREMQLRIMEGDKTWLREKMQTDIDGKLSFNFAIPPKANAGRLVLLAEDIRKGEVSSSMTGSANKRLAIPLNIARSSYTDVQFMPEGGQLVAGLTSRVGFKAVGENGKGVDITGVVVSNTGSEVSSFGGSYKGIGSFTLSPAAGETYTAKVTFTDGSTKSYALPIVKPSGVVLAVAAIPGRDSILVSVQGTAAISGSPFSLVGQSGGRVCYASNISLSKGTLTGKIAKSRFPTGITRFTLFSDSRQPVAERLVFIDHQDNLRIRVTPDKSSYQPKDSITLNIQVTDKENNPVQGSFSLAVTDNSQVKADSSNVADISSYMLLTGNLKGDIEEPGHYFAAAGPGTEQQLDNLLLTQGWVGYDWKDIFDKAYTPKFKAEKEIEVTGTISRVSGKPLAGIPVSLLSTKKPSLFMDTVTNAEGRFAFRNLPRIDTAAFMVQLKDNKRRMFEAQIKVDEFTPAETKSLQVPNNNPWYVNSDSTLLNYNKQNIAMQKELDKLNFPDGGGTRLKEVVIKAKKVVKGSKNLNGAGNADQVLDEEDMKKAGKTTLLQMLNNGVIKGFGETFFPLGLKASEKLEFGKWNFKIFDKKLRLIIDGVDLNFLYSPMQDAEGQYEEYNFVKTYLEQITAEDVKGIEVLYNNNYGNKYGPVYLKPQEYIATTIPRSNPNYMAYAYLEITTWSGFGTFMKRTHGRYLYRPLPVSWPKQFYKPKYSVNTAAFLQRPTTYWEPGITTDASGKAAVTFYTGPKPTGYTLIIQGSDLSGAVGRYLKRLSTK